MMIKPREYSTSGQTVKPKKVTAGQKLFAPIGVAYTKSSVKGTLCLNLYCIVISDLEKDNNEGIIHVEKFWISERALWKIANWSISMRFDAEFDCEDRDSIEKIIAHGQVFLGNVKVTDDGEYTRREIDSFMIPEKIVNQDGGLSLTDEMNKYIIQGEEAFPKMIESARNYGTVFINPKEGKAVLETINDGYNEFEGEEIPF